MINKTCALIIRLFAIILFASAQAFAQENIGFEKGNFDNWDFGVGSIAVSGDMTIYDSFAVPGSFTMLENDKSGRKDEYGKFSVFSPNGGKYSVMLGNTVFGNGVQQMSYRFTVPPSGINSIIFDYAVVLVSPGHEPKQQPRFTVKIYNVTDEKYINCPSFDFAFLTNLPGFKFANDSVVVKDWASASINLKGLNNKDIRLEFTVNHCPFKHHFGYAYIDVHEDIGEPIKGNYYCPEQAAITLSAPPGFASYSWYTSDFKTLLHTGQNLTIPPPPNLTQLAVTVTPYNGVGCPDTLYTTVHASNSEYKFVAKQEIIGCPGSAVDLTQASVTAGSSPGLKFEYLTEAFELLSSPYDITQSGLYYIRATNAGGCSNLLPVKITFGLPELNIINPPTAVYPETVDLSKSFTPEQGVAYGYYIDAGTTIPLANFKALDRSGTYFIKAESAEGCVNVQPVTVTVQPPKPFTLTVPNTFTPNGDGINDQFRIALEGYISFNGLKVYNRNGGLMFRTTNSTQFWDGTYNGHQAPAGTYYWVFEGFDEYYHKKVNESSFITLLR
nr:gliding motility-associated C-terminal domain-containing protein [uncultured Mucilaginibacter sp.]